MALVISSTTDDQAAVNAAAGIVEEPEVAERPKQEPIEPDTEDEEEEQEPEEDDSTEPTKPKPKGGFQRKIERLKAQADAREQRIRELEAERQRYATPPQEQVPRQPQGPPKPEDFPNDYESYNRAIIRYEARQELESELQARVKAQREAAEQKAQQEIDQRWYQGVNALKREATDFEEALEDVSHIPVMPWLQAAIKRDKDGARLAYELARHPDEFQRIAEIQDPLEALSALGEFRGSLKAAAAPQQPRKVASDAPNPIRPVGQSAGGTRVSRNLDELPYQDYKRAREQQIKARKQR